MNQGSFPVITHFANMINDLDDPWKSPCQEKVRSRWTTKLKERFEQLNVWDIGKKKHQIRFKSVQICI